MSDAPATAAPVKTTKKRAGGTAKPKKPATHPKYSEMITAALAALKERGGSSRQAILKYVVSHYKLGQDDHIVNSHLKMALRAGVKNGSLKQSKGSGAAGSFRLGEKTEKKAAKKAAKPKSPKKAVKPKSPKKAKAASSPKKAKAAKPKKAATSGEAKPKKAKVVKKVKSPAKKVKSPAKATKPKTSKAAKPKAGGRKK